MLSAVAPEPAHLVQFYEQEDSLYRVVAEFLAPGFAQRRPMVVIATAPHRRAFVKALEHRGCDVAAAHASGLLTLLDARECLAQFMSDGSPDPELFRERIGGAVKAATHRSLDGRILAYGEMVDLLWRDENPKAALALEELWNALGTQHQFTLLCAYGMGGFGHSGHRADFERVCATHTHVRPTERYPWQGESVARLRELTLLEQRALSLENELKHRGRIEAELRAALAEHSHTEAALRVSEQNLTDFVENAAVGIHAVGPDGVILWANRAELELLGYSKEEYVGRHITELHVDRPAIDDMLLRLGRNETLLDHPARLRCKDGSVKDVRINSNALFRDGALVHTRCFTRDVTRLEAQEKELARTAHFTEQFVGMLGHDLRNPLSAITTAAGLLRRRSVEDKVVKPAERIMNSADRMAAMVDQLLEFTRMHLGSGLTLQRSRVDLAELCRIVVDECGAGRVRFEQRGEALGEWDGDRLAQVGTMLIGNALAHSEAGAPVAMVVDGTEPSRVRLSVQNPGVIPPAALPTLFEPLQTKRTGSTGLGLGLYIGRQVALAHHGNLEVQSNEASGTTFTLTLPRLPR